ncbi:MAG: aminoglycoside phosphotransferase family protein [Nanoarchaeota archaeon]|nr:aminoglycoside phosphotransferase family protein [Nanoarchaeota archaeon]
MEWIRYFDEHPEWHGKSISEAVDSLDHGNEFYTALNEWAEQESRGNARLKEIILAKIGRKPVRDLDLSLRFPQHIEDAGKDLEEKPVWETPTGTMRSTAPYSISGGGLFADSPIVDNDVQRRDRAERASKDLEKRVLTLEEIDVLPGTHLICDRHIVDIADYLKERKQIFSLNPFRKVPDEIKARHALKIALGRFAYNRFYAEMLLQSLKDEYKKKVSPEQLEEINKLLAGNKHAIPVYETQVDEVSLHTLLGNGGLYRVDMFPLKDLRLRNFVKRYAREENFRKAIQIEKLLSTLSRNVRTPEKDQRWSYRTESERLDLVLAPRHFDKSNLLVAVPFIDGMVLSDALKMNDKLKAHVYDTDGMLRNTLDDWARLVNEATDFRNTQWYDNGTRGYGFTDARGKELLDTIDYTSSFINRFIFRSEEFEKSGNKKARQRKLAGDKDLSELVDLYTLEISAVLNAADKTFVHGDLHLNNILIPTSESERNTRFIDFEMAAYTLPQFDLVKFIRKGGIAPGQERELVDYAFDALHNTRNEVLVREIDVFREAGRDVSDLEKELARREERNLATEDKRKRFRQNYLRLRTHEDTLYAVKCLDRAQKAKKRKALYKSTALTYFKRALETIENPELRNKLFDAGMRLFDDLKETYIQDLQEFQSSQATNSAQVFGSETQFGMLEEHLKKEKRKRIIKKTCKIGIPLAAAVIGLGYFGLQYKEAKEIEAIRSREVDRYEELIRIEPRQEQITVNEFWNIDADFPEIYDPTIPEEEREKNLEYVLVRPQIIERAKAYSGAEGYLCGPGDTPECWEKGDPVHAFGSRVAYDHIDQRMIRALLLTSQWMNSRGVDGYWGDRRWGIQGHTCNSPVIYYNGRELPLTQCEQLQRTADNILATYKRLNDALRTHPQLEDAIANLFSSEELIGEFKGKTDEENYWRYSAHPEFPQEIRDFIGAFLVIYDQLKRAPEDGR